MSNTYRLSARDALFEAGFEVLSRDATATLAQIAERAGVGRATLHRHFAGRDEFVRALALRAIAEMDDAAEKACEPATSHLDALRLSLKALAPLGARHGFLLRISLDHEPEIEAEYQRQLKETRELVDAAKREGGFRADIPNAWIVHAYDNLLFAAWESIRAGDATPAQAAELAWRTLIDGTGN